MSNEDCFITYPTWIKYIVLSTVIESLQVKEKRQIFQIMRKTEDLSPHTFFPHYGLFAGDFATWQILCDKKKKKNNTLPNDRGPKKDLYS